VRLVTPTNRATGVPELKGEYYRLEDRAYVRASNVVDALAPEDNLLDKIREKGWDWWDERGLAADLGTAVHAEIEKLHHWFNRQSEQLDRGELTLRQAAPQFKKLTLLGSEEITFTPTFTVVWDGEEVVFDLVAFVETYAAGFLLPDVDEVIFAEKKVWSERYAYAGTLDALVRLRRFRRRGWIALVDVKTSKRLSWGYRLQTSAYVQALKETDGILCDCRLIVDLPSDKQGEAIKIVEYGGDEDTQREDFTTFWGCLRAYRFRDHYKNDWKM
jgi:hypothetical protein